MSGQGWAALTIVTLAILFLARRCQGKRGGCCGDSCACGRPGASAKNRR